jgi:hypothetical protein
VLAFAAWAAFAGPGEAAPPQKPQSPQAWRAAAAEDLQAIHDILRDNAPAMVVSRDSVHFRRWLEEGLRRAEAGLPKVTDARGYYFTLQGYAAGFRDNHILIDHNRGSGVFTDPVAWPGFLLALRGENYEVAFRAPDAPGAPPLGARLLGCDGKPVAALVAAHDRFDGDLQLAAARAVHAPDLLLDRADPFVPRARACTFETAGAARTYRLDWRKVDKPAAAEIASATAPAAPGKLGLARWGPRRWWITIPSMEEDQPWTAFFDDVKAHLSEVRGAEDVVIDLRGNDGGSGEFAEQLVQLLWGDSFAAAHHPDFGPTVWRASKLNRDYWARAVEQIGKNPEFPEATKVYARRILAGLDAAIAKGEPTFTIEDAAPAKARGAPGPDPMRGRVVLLTDAACASACLDLMDFATPMPNVIQAGEPTSADSIFMELTIVPALPSGLTAFGFGHKAWIRRPRGSNVAYVPAPGLTWPGGKAGDAAVKGWLDKALARITPPPRG